MCQGWAGLLTVPFQISSLTVSVSDLLLTAADKPFSSLFDSQYQLTNLNLSFAQDCTKGELFPGHLKLIQSGSKNHLFNFGSMFAQNRKCFRIY